MKTKFVLLTLLFLFIGRLHTMAQKAPKDGEKFNWGKNHMDEAGIPADIQAKIETIKTDAATKVKEVKKGTSTEEEKKAQIKVIQKKKGDDIMALLTKEQKQKIKQIKDRLKNDEKE